MIDSLFFYMSSSFSSLWKSSLLLLSYSISPFSGLMKAFQLLDPQSRGYLCFSQFFELMRTLKPTAELPEVRFYFELLDRDGNSQVNIAFSWENCGEMGTVWWQLTVERKNLLWSASVFCGGFSLTDTQVGKFAILHFRFADRPLRFPRHARGAAAPCHSTRSLRCF